MNTQAKTELLKQYYLNKLGVNLSLSEVTELQRSARKAQRLALDLCNGAIEQDAYDKAHAKIWAKMVYCFAGTKISPTKVKIEGDPRGYCLKIYTNETDYVCPEYFN